MNEGGGGGDDREMEKGEIEGGKYIRKQKG